MTQPAPEVHGEPLPSQIQRSARKLKVCQVIASAEGGRWLVEQLRDLRDINGCDVMAVVGGERGSLIDTLRSNHIPYFVENFQFGSLRGTLGLPFTILRQARLFRRERVDVVQSHLFFSMVVTRFAGWLADVPVRLSMYASPFHLQAPLTFWIDQATCSMDSMLIPACQLTMDLCREMGVKDEKMALVYYGPDERQFDPEQVQPAKIREEYGWPADTPLIGQIAFFYAKLPSSRWVPECMHERGVKGLDDLVRATPHILAEIPNAKVLLIGSGWGEAGIEHMEDVKELVRTLGLENSVIFTGYRSDANEVLKALDVAVQASLVECLGGTIEALLMECPTVATRVGGLVDTVRDGETGILVEPSNPRDLARGIVQMLRDREKGRVMGRAGRQLMIERFTLRTTVRDLYKVYTEVSDRRGRGHNSLLSGWRMIAAIPVFAYLASRYLFLELFFHIYWPIYVACLKNSAYRIYQRARQLGFLVLRPFWRVMPESSRVMRKQSLRRSDSE
ncbi:MAG TPA: glycosyltransferase [Pyrinomonadaceae bacterium]|nr:glycosyltransferase [Pyrinomonadaceae bacterium]